MYDVALVGYGPTGATLANLLALQGLNVLVLEREAKIYHLPRAVHFDDEVMRVFQTVGIADDLLPLVHVNPGMKFVDQSGTAPPRLAQTTRDYRTWMECQLSPTST